MASYLCGIVCAVFLLVQPSLSFHSTHWNNTTLSENLHRRQSGAYWDASDLSSIRSLGAIGDSYSAGIGAGNRLGSIHDAFDSQSDWSCSRYDGSYPYLLANSPDFGDTPPQFQFLSCSGALTGNVLNTQIPKLNSGQDAIVLSVGGNDVELTNILNQCIFQWASFDWSRNNLSEVRAKIADQRGWAAAIDYQAIGRGCDAQLSRTADLIASGSFRSALDKVANAALTKLGDGGMIYWTGYAKFFAEDLSPDCNKVSWSIWKNTIVSYFQATQYLTQDSRRRMNSLVDQVNAQLKAAVARAGPRVVFVDYDEYVGRYNGRYCEAGVDESSVQSNTRAGLMFYELNTDDKYGTTPLKRSDDDNLDLAKYNGLINAFGDMVLIVDPDAKFANPQIDPAASRRSTNKLAKRANAAITAVLPDGYGRAFHPQILLHQFIANLITYNMRNERQLNQGFDEIPEDDSIESCPLTSQAIPNWYARILPLGASIVWGVGSSTGNGFRKPLRDALRQAGWNVNMVGSKNNGNMNDNNVEAHSGDRVDQIQAAASLSTKYKPNIIVLNAGTNDCLQRYDISNFGSRFNSLLDSLFQAIPQVTIVVSTVLPGTASGILENRESVNIQIRRLVSDRRFNQYQRIVLADVDSPSDFLTTDYISSDGIHPNDEGHRRLAAIYLRAIDEAYQASFLSPPADTGIPDGAGIGPRSNTCDKVYGSGQSHGPFQTQQGSGLDDGPYIHNSVGPSSDQIVDTINTNFTYARIWNPFANHDLVKIGPISGKQRIYTYWRNNGTGIDMSKGYTIAMDDTCIARGVRFVDVNADGYDDMVCIAPNGDAYVSLWYPNQKYAPPRLWKANEGPDQAHVRLADIDGDGRADYCTIADNGDISCWRNGGQGNMPDYWQSLGIIFTGKGYGDIAGVRFVDLNGDGRDDWIWMDDTGRTWTYLNNRGCTKGTLAPSWRKGANIGNTDYTHGGMGRQVGRQNIYFARIKGQSAAFSLAPLADYLFIENTGPVSVKTAPGLYNYRINLWQSKGAGAAKLKADGDRYCNMLGRSNGAMDYVWIHSTGYMILYESFGGNFPQSPPYWGSNYQIWSARERYGFDIDRRDLHLADWNGDGYCDILYVDPKTKKVDVWINGHISSSNANAWTRLSGSDTNPNSPCGATRGVGIFDLAVRFADLDGDGRADYLCINPDGLTFADLNHGTGNFESVSQVKKSEGKDRANLRFVDVNADGRADMLWVDKFSGDATVWYNQGKIKSGDSSFTWDYRDGKPAYQGAGQGACLQWGDLDGDRRADMSLTDSYTNTAQTWFNVCPGQGSSTNGDDSDTLSSAALPQP